MLPWKSFGCIIMKSFKCCNNHGFFMRILTFILLFFLFGICFAEELPVSSQKEINHLFTFIKTSDCQFYRNGSWHAATDAAGHIEKKYNYFMKKGKITSAETFIKFSATESTMSRRKYKVKCGDSTEIESAAWLKSELSRFRTK